MDFGDILAQWESSQKNESHKKKNAVREDGGAWRHKKREPDARKDKEINSLEVEMKNANEKRINEQELWMMHHGTVDKDSLLKKMEEDDRLESAEYLRRLMPEGRIDLHGLTRDEAWSKLDRFITECAQRGLRKVIIVHGKGNHSQEEPVLFQMVKSFIEHDVRLGSHGHPDRSEGGKGSTWVIIR